MIQNLTIKNFKAHKSTEMKELANVNILLGKNNSGKTGVLEALLFLSLPSNPRDVLTRLNELRGYKPGTDFEEIWDSLFYNWDHSQKICIESIETNDQPTFVSMMDKIIQKNLCIRPIIREKRVDSSIGIIEGSDFVGTTQGLSFTFKSPNFGNIEREVTNLTRKPGRQAIDDLKSEKTVVFIPARGIFDPQDEAQRFSRLEITNRHNDIVDILKILEPNLERLFIVASKKGSVIYGDIGIEHPIPLPLMGDGMLHTLAIALAMVNSQNGLVLIDEIENGLHYSVLTDVWKMIFQTSQKLDVQVFVATHSDECLKAAYEAVESLGCYNNLKLYRFDKTKDGTRVEDYTADELFHAITSKIEVR